jgi:hypothetical protein
MESSRLNLFLLLLVMQRSRSVKLANKYFIAYFAGVGWILY